MRRNDRIATGAVVGIAAVAVFAIGGAPRWAVCTLAVLSALACVPLLSSRKQMRAPSPLLYLLGAMWLATLGQMLPLPSAIVRAVSPHTAEAWTSRWAVLGQEPAAFMPISLDPAGTLIELAKLTAYICIAYVASRLAASSQGRRSLFTTVIGLSTILALTGLVHHALNAERLFGLYEPMHNTPLYLSPLINPNHHAGLLALSVPLSLAMALEVSGRERVIWFSTAALCLGASLLPRSRSAALALVAGATVFAAVALLSRWLRPRERSSQRVPLRVALPALVTASSLLALVVITSAGGVLAELDETASTELLKPRSKFQAWHAALELVTRFPVTGIGRGAFESTFPSVHPASAFHTYSHVENEYFQAVIDWGIPVAVTLALFLSWCIVVASKRWRRDYLAAGALGAMVVIALQSFVDFGLEVPGVAVPTILVLSTLTYASMRVVKESSRRVVTTRAALPAGAVAVALLAASPLGRPIGAARAQLSELARESEPGERERVLRAARRLMERHPTDYYAPSVIAREQLARGDAQEMTRFLNHAFNRHPTHPGLHALAARALMRAGRREQAAIEYRAAIHYSAAPLPYLQEVLAAFPTPAAAADAIPADPRGARRLARQLGQLGASDVSLALMKRSAAAEPPIQRNFEYLANLAAHKGELDTAIEAARRAHELSASPNTAQLLGNLLIQAKHFDDAQRIFETAVTWRASPQVSAELRLSLGEVYFRQERYEEARSALASIVQQSSQVNRGTLVQAHKWLAAIERRLGNEHQADWQQSRVEALRSP